MAISDIGSKKVSIAPLDIIDKNSTQELPEKYTKKSYTRTTVKRKKKKESRNGTLGNVEGDLEDSVFTNLQITLNELMQNSQVNPMLLKRAKSLQSRPVGPKKVDNSELLGIKMDTPEQTYSNLKDVLQNA